jgi:hypothetical protein
MANNMDVTNTTNAIANGENTPRSTSRSIRVPAGVQGGPVAPPHPDGLTLVHVFDDGPSLSARASAQRAAPLSDERPQGAGGAQMLGIEDNFAEHDVTVTEALVEASGMAASAAASAAGPIIMSSSLASLGAATGAVVANQIAKSACEQIPIVGGLVSPLAQATASMNGAGMGALVGGITAQNVPSFTDMAKGFNNSDMARAMKSSCTRRNRSASPRMVQGPNRGLSSEGSKQVQNQTPPTKPLAQHDQREELRETSWHEMTPNMDRFHSIEQQLQLAVQAIENQRNFVTESMDLMNATVQQTATAFDERLTGLRREIRTNNQGDGSERGALSDALPAASPQITELISGKSRKNPFSHTLRPICPANRRMATATMDLLWLMTPNA